MDNKQINTLDEVLENDKELQRELKKENKGNKKGILAVIAAIIAAIGVAASTIALSVGKKNGNGQNTTTPTTSSSFDLDDMGDELTTNSTTKTAYKVVSGNIDPNKIVEQNGKLYKDATEASKAQNKTTTVDLKNDTLKTSVVKENGTTTVKVYDKTTGYEIKDETGKTVATGNLDNSGIPSGYAYDSVLKKYLPKEEVGKYVYADATYYDNQGTEVLKKGDVVLKETLEKAKKYFSTTTTTKATTTTTVKPSTTTTTVKNNSTTTTTKATTTTTSNEGVVNKDGTYTIFGLTFKTKADYQQWVIQGYEGYVEADGIMISQEELNNRLQKTK